MWRYAPKKPCSYCWQEANATRNLVRDEPEQSVHERRVELRAGYRQQLGRRHLHPSERIRERAHIGAGARLEDVGGDALAGAHHASEFEHDRRLAEGVLATGHGVDAKLPQAGIDAGSGVDGPEDGVDGSVARERADQLLAMGGRSRTQHIEVAGRGKQRIFAAFGRIEHGVE